jgi:hypothetical protein
VAMKSAMKALRSLRRLVASFRIRFF